MAHYPVERLYRQVVVRYHIENAHAVNVVVEVFARVFVIQLAQNAFSRMPERRVSDVVAYCYRFDEIGIETQRTAYLACYTRNEMHV